MSSPGRIRIKICCISSADEAQLAIDAGADALGLVSAMPSGPGVIAEETIAAIAKVVPAKIATFLLTSCQNAEEIIAQHRRCGTTTIQICDRFDAKDYQKLRAALPKVRLVQVIHVRDQSSVAEAEAVAPHVDALLLDSGNQSLLVKELGGTGRVHDWNFSWEICAQASVPVFLAGGLNPQNVAEAIEKVRPFGVDICSGVRTDGRLDPTKLREFVSAVRACDNRGAN